MNMYYRPARYEVHIDPITGKEVVFDTLLSRMNAIGAKLNGMEQEYNENVGYSKLVEYFTNLNFDKSHNNFEGSYHLHINRHFYLSSKSLDSRRRGDLGITTEPLKYSFLISINDPYKLEQVEVKDALFDYQHKAATINPRPVYLDESACKKIENKYFELIEAIENSLEASWEDILKNMV